MANKIYPYFNVVVMKKTYLSIVALMLATMMQAQMKSFVLEGQSRTYESVSWDNKPLKNIGERTFFIFWQESGKLKGRLNGTTDEIVTAREGYRPGYIVAPLHDIKVINDSTITFSIANTMQFGCELPLYVKNEAEATQLGYPSWADVSSNSLPPSQRQYTVSFSGKTLIIRPDGAYDKFERLFRLPQ